MHGYVPRPDEVKIAPMIRELMEYLWDTYLDNWQPDDIVLMGVGDSYFGVKLLLTMRGKSIPKKNFYLYLHR